MSIVQSDSDQTLPLTLVGSFWPPDIFTIDMATSAGQPAVTNQVSNQATTNPNVTNTNQSVVNTSTNQGANSHPIHHEWVKFRLEVHSDCSLGQAQMKCWSIALIMHQELGVMPLQIWWLNYHDVLIEFNREVDVRWVAQKLFRMEWWKDAPCHLEYVPCSNE